ncbi:MAG: TIGR02266 family protein [Deltaproteobacteria bacterium]|nr:TIGR02266 family protein [Deltaproteobacteria bacterium]
MHGPTGASLPTTDAMVRVARAARGEIANALRILQGQSEPRTATIENIAKRMTQAVGALYAIELAPADAQAIHHSVGEAVRALGLANNRLREILDSGGAREEAAAAVARVLASLYPIAEAAASIPHGHESGEWEPPPIPLSTRRIVRVGEDASDRRGSERVSLETTIGMHSESYFYAGRAQDLSDGGIFVATYATLPVGTEVTVSFLLPDGRPILATGIVRWTREARETSGPGVGVAFDGLARETLEAIRGYVAGR